MSLWFGIALVGGVLALLNARGTLRIWRSGVYERGQLLAQTALIWVIPGSVFAVLSLLRDDGRSGKPSDSTAANPETPNADAMNGTTGHTP